MKIARHASLAGTLLLLSLASACAALPPAAAPRAATTVAPAPTPAPAQPVQADTATAAPSPVQPASGTPRDDLGPRALVDAYLRAWANRSAEEVAGLFADKVEFQMGPNYITDRGALLWYFYYWIATDGRYQLVSCDPAIGETIRCDLVYESDCERLIDGQAFHFDTRFTVERGKIVKALSTMGPGELQKLSARLGAVFEWAETNMPAEYKRHYELTTNDFTQPQVAGNTVAQICAAYGAAHPTTPAPPATP